MSDPTPRGEASKSKWANPVIRERIIAGQRAYWNNLDGTPNLQIRKERGKIAKAALASPEVRHNISEGTKEGLKPAEVRRKIANASTKAWDGNTKRHEEASKTATTVFSDPEVEQKRKEGFDRPETKEKISAGGKLAWKDDEGRKQRTSEQFTQLWAQRRADMQEAGRLKNVEGLDLVMGLRLSLIAHVNKTSLYDGAPDIYPDSHNPTNAIKQPVTRFPAIIELEKQRIAKLTEIQRLAEGQDLKARLRRELTTRGKL